MIMNDHGLLYVKVNSENCFENSSTTEMTHHIRIVTNLTFFMKKKNFILF